MSDPILELLAAPPSPTMRVDEDAVLIGGRRRVRRRALRRTTVGLVGALGAAAVAFAMLGTGAGPDALPAGPSTSSSTSSQRVSAALFDGAWSVEVRPGAAVDEPNVVFYKGSGAGRQQLAGSSADSSVVSMGKGSGAEGMLLGTAPADLATSLTIAPGATGGIQQDEALLPGTDYKAIALKFDDPSDVDTYRDTIWLDARGVVHHADGSVVPSVLVPGTDERLFVARSEAQVLGVVSPGGGATKPLTPSGLTVLGVGTKDDGAAWDWRSSTLLPTGATGVTFTWSPGTAPGAVRLLPLPDGSGTIATATATAPATSDGPTLLEVTWTDAAGTRHTDRVQEESGVPNASSALD